MTDTNALAGGDAPTSTEQTVTAPTPPETTPTAQNEPEAKEGDEPTEPKDGDPAADDAGSDADPEKNGRKTAKEFIAQLTRERNEQALARYAAEQEIKRLKRPLVAKEGMSELARAALEIRNADRAEDLKDAEDRHAAAVHAEKTKRKETFEARVGDTAIVDKFYKVQHITDAMADALVESDHASQLAAYFAGNPKEAERISRMEPHLQGLAIGRIEARVSKQPEVRKTSKAPEPSTNLKGGSAPARKTAGDMSYVEYKAMREKQIGQR